MLRILVAVLLFAAAAPASAFAPERTRPLAPEAPAEAPAASVPGGSVDPGTLDDEPEDGEEGLPAPVGPAGREEPAGPPPQVFYGDKDLPNAVRETRAKIMAAAATGDPEALRPLLTADDPPTAVSPIEGGDPVDVLVAQAGDPEGREILAILMDVLDAGWVHIAAGTPDERWVWPYFAELPPDGLDGRQMVEVYRVLTAADFDSMRAAGTYVFYKVEIGPDGRWMTFMSGE